MKLILGSSSKYRKSVLEKAGYTFETMSPDIDEMAIRSSDLYELPLLLARAKSEKIVSDIKEPALIITADIVVICNGELLEKPQSEQEVRDWLKKYSEGHPAECVCGVVVANTETGSRVEDINISKVYFHPMPDEMVTEFIKMGEPYGRAGGFAVQLPIFQPYLKKVEGTYESIVGMPMDVIERLLHKAQA
jgi:septum formation protein